MTALLASTAGNVAVWIVWIGAALALLSSAIAVVLFSNPFFSALALMGNLGSLAVLYLLISAEFVAAAQVLVYAGAIVVLFVFVIAYLGGRADAPWRGVPRVGSIVAIVAGIAIAVEVMVAIGVSSIGGLSSAAEISDSFGSPREIGRLFLADHLLAFEVTSIVLFVAAVGAAVLGGAVRRAEREEEQESADEGAS